MTSGTELTGYVNNKPVIFTKDGKPFRADLLVWEGQLVRNVCHRVHIRGAKLVTWVEQNVRQGHRVTLTGKWKHLSYTGADGKTNRVQIFHPTKVELHRR